MIRRAFITLLGGAAAWPVAARAQQTMPVVGFLSPHLRRPATHFLEAFRWGLAETGFSAGRMLGSSTRWADQAECERLEVRHSWQKATLRSVACHVGRPG